MIYTAIGVQVVDLTYS